MPLSESAIETASIAILKPTGRFAEDALAACAAVPVAFHRWIWRHRSLEQLEQLVDEEISDRQREVYSHVRQNFESIMHGTASAQIGSGRARPVPASTARR